MHQGRPAQNLQWLQEVKPWAGSSILNFMFYAMRKELAKGDGSKLNPGFELIGHHGDSGLTTNVPCCVYNVPNDNGHEHVEDTALSYLTVVSEIVMVLCPSYISMIVAQVSIL